MSSMEHVNNLSALLVRLECLVVCNRRLCYDMTGMIYQSVPSLQFTGPFVLLERIGWWVLLAVKYIGEMQSKCKQ